MRKTIFFAALVFTAAFAQAAVIDFSQIYIGVDERGEALVQHLLLIDSRSGEEVRFQVLNNQNIRVFDQRDLIEYKEENNVVSFFPQNLTENYGVTIEYTSSDLTTKSNGNWEFGFQLKPLNEFKEMKIKLGLPRNIILSSHAPEALVFSGKNGLEIEWVLENSLTEPIVLNAEYFFSGAGGEKSEENLIFLTVFGFFVLIVFGTIVFFYLKTRKKEESKTVIEKPIEIEKPGGIEKPIESENLIEKKAAFSIGQKDLMKLLTENEEKVLEELVKGDGVFQRNLLAKTGLPKSTLSRTLKKLEVKGLVKVNNIGLTNKIELSKEFKEK